MRAEYDFSKGERGKFYRPGMTITIPVRVQLGQASVSFLAEKAEKKGISLELWPRAFSKPKSHSCSVPGRKLHRSGDPVPPGYLTLDMRRTAG
jgi:hypothetical protein